MSRDGRRRSQPRQPSAGSSRPAEPTPQRPPPAASQRHRDLVALVTADELDTDLPLLYNTIGDRLNAIAAARLAKAMARLSLGDRVRTVTTSVPPMFTVCRPPSSSGAPTPSPSSSTAPSTPYDRSALI
jgi:hypothetical protein